VVRTRGDFLESVSVGGPWRAGNSLKNLKRLGECQSMIGSEGGARFVGAEVWYAFGGLRGTEGLVESWYGVA
jgi:hypothetical protein